jgi:hypothetical protein
MTEDLEWVQASRVYFHKGSSTSLGAVYAEPFMGVSFWKEDEQIAALLGRQFSNWSDWKEEVMVVKASVKISKQLPHFEEDTNSDLASIVEGLAKPGCNEGAEDTYTPWLKLLKGESGLQSEEMFGSTTIGRINLIHDSHIALGEATDNNLKPLQVGLGVQLNELEFQMEVCLSSEMGRQLEGASICILLEDLQSLKRR